MSLKQRKVKREPLKFQTRLLYYGIILYQHFKCSLIISDGKTFFKSFIFPTSCIPIQVHIFSVQSSLWGAILFQSSNDHPAIQTHSVIKQPSASSSVTSTSFVLFQVFLVINSISQIIKRLCREAQLASGSIALCCISLRCARRL